MSESNTTSAVAAQANHAVSAPAPHDLAAAYVAALTGSTDTVIDVRMLHDSDKGAPAEARRGTLSECWKWITALNQQGYGAFVTVNETDGQGRSAEHIDAARAVWVDLDGVDAQAQYEAAAAWQPAASFAVSSSPERWHIYWTLAPGCPVDVAEGINKRLRVHFNGDPNACDRARVLRLPGTVNHKRGAPGHAVTCHALSGHGQPVDHAALEAALAHVIVPDGGNGERHPLGDPELGAPTLDWLKRALELVDPNDLSRSEWIAHTAAFKQAGWSLTDEGTLRGMWDQWCAQYETVGDDGRPLVNDTGENTKQWASIRSTELGWPSLLRRIPALRAAVAFGEGGVDAPGAPVPVRALDDLLNDAAKLAPDDAVGIGALATEAGQLDPVPCDVVLRAIQTATGIGITPLRAQAREAIRTTEPDQLALAAKALERLGGENVLYADQFFWKWAERGVWCRVPDTAIKQEVQASIAQEGIAVSDARVSGTTGVLRNHIYKPEHQFNVRTSEHKHTVNMPSGELDLTSAGWRLGPHRRERYLTTQIPVAYDPAATAPMFCQFLEDVFRDDEDKVQKATALLEMIGYSLMPYADLDRFAVLYGHGANGKSVVLSLVRALAGAANSAGVQPTYFEDQHHCAHLDGKLVNIVTDLDVEKPLSAGAAKRLASGELMTVAHKHRDPFDIQPFATCWFGTNHLPKVHDRSNGFWRRALVLTFNRAFAPHEQDRELKEKLVSELPGILNLALDYYANALRCGFTNPPSSVEMVEQWRAENDQMSGFIAECCKVRPGASVGSSNMYAAYVGWAHRTHHGVMSHTKFSTEMKRQPGITAGKSNTAKFGGIELIHN